MNDKRAKTEVTIDLLTKELERTEKRYQEALDEYLDNRKDDDRSKYVEDMKYNYLVILKRIIFSLNEKIDQHLLKDD